MNQLVHKFVQIIEDNKGISTKEGMIEYLKSQLNVKKTITFGTIPGRYDYVVKEGNTNEVVHTLKKLFEPYFFNKKLKTT